MSCVLYSPGGPYSSVRTSDCVVVETAVARAWGIGAAVKLPAERHSSRETVSSELARSTQTPRRPRLEVVQKAEIVISAVLVVAGHRSRSRFGAVSCPSPLLLLVRMPPSASPRASSSSSLSSRPRPAADSSSLSSIVASLTRAQFGQGAAPDKVADDDLDRHVAEILLKEARDKDSQWNEKGTRAYYDPAKEK